MMNNYESYESLYRVTDGTLSVRSNSVIDKEYLGSDFDDFLRKEGILDDAEAVATKRVIDSTVARK